MSGPLRCEFPACTDWANAMHHVKTKARGGSDSPANLVPLCQGPGTADHHGWVHANPEKAHALGLLKHSWEAEAV